MPILALVSRGRCLMCCTSVELPQQGMTFRLYSLSALGIFYFISFPCCFHSACLLGMCWCSSVVGICPTSMTTRVKQVVLHGYFMDIPFYEGTCASQRVLCTSFSICPDLPTTFDLFKKSSFPLMDFNASLLLLP